MSSKAQVCLTKMPTRRQTSAQQVKELLQKTTQSEVLQPILFNSIERHIAIIMCACDPMHGRQWTLQTCAFLSQPTFRILQVSVEVAGISDAVRAVHQATETVAPGALSTIPPPAPAVSYSLGKKPRRPQDLRQHLQPLST
jgi:hypothetical protein